MAIRTTSGAVQKILNRDYDTLRTPTLEPYIATASSIVDDMAQYVSDNGLTPVPSAAKKELIERWLAAHCYCMSDQPYRESTTQRASAVFQGDTKMYLEATKYGQMALILDTTGALAAVANGVSVSLHWLGKSVPDQLSYDERN